MRTFGKLERADVGGWDLTAEPHVILRAKRVFAGVSRQHGGTLTISNTLENSRDLHWFLERYPCDMSRLVRRELEQAVADHLERETIVHKLLAGKMQAKRFDLALPPRDYQRVAADLWLRMGGMLLGDDLGTGKTISAICGLTDPRTRPALVVTMTSLTRQWQREFAKFAPNLRTHILRKGTPYDLTRKVRRRVNPEQLSLDVPTGGFPDVVITSYSKLSGWAETLAGVVNGVVFDEVQELRHGEASNKGSAAYAISRQAAYRLGMTATPIYNHGGEIFAVVEAVAPGALGEREEFITEWCRSVGEGKYALKDAKAFGMHLRDTGLMLRRTRSDVGRELPPRTVVLHDIETDSQPFEDIQSAAENLAKIIIARRSEYKNQLRDTAREFDVMMRHATGVAKAPYVAEFVRLLVESGESVVLYGWHRDVYAIWCERLKDLHPFLYTGSEGPAAKDAAARAFMGRDEGGNKVEPETKLLIMSLRAGVGLDGLQDVCQTVVFGELDWSPGVHEQCIGRVFRDGQGKNVAVYYLIADEGSDPVVVDLLGVKREQVEHLRNPNLEVTEKLEVDPARIRALAQQYLVKQGKEPLVPASSSSATAEGAPA